MTSNEATMAIAATSVPAIIATLFLRGRGVENADEVGVAVTVMVWWVCDEVVGMVGLAGGGGEVVDNVCEREEIDEEATESGVLRDDGESDIEDVCLGHSARKRYSSARLALALVGLDMGD